MKFSIDLVENFKQLVKQVEEGKMHVESISMIPYLQPRYITDDLKETERKNKVDYYEYTITIRDGGSNKDDKKRTRK